MALEDMSTPVDLGWLARDLARVFAETPPEGFVVGRTAIRDAVAQKLSCSQLEAEQLVDSLVVRGKLLFVPDEGPGWWRFQPEADRTAP